MITIESLEREIDRTERKIKRIGTMSEDEICIVHNVDSKEDILAALEEELELLKEELSLAMQYLNEEDLFSTMGYEDYDKAMEYEYN